MYRPLAPTLRFTPRHKQLVRLILFDAKSVSYRETIERKNTLSEIVEHFSPGADTGEI